eukprot:10799994-Alexandrium_andersonii.AAC.1
MCSDSASETVAAMKDFRILPQHSHPGMSADSAVAERTNRVVLEMTRSALAQVGPLAGFWAEAAPR